MQSSEFRPPFINQREKPLPPGGRMPEHRHSFWEIGWVVEGEAFWHLAGGGSRSPRRKLRLRKAEAVVVPPRCYHYEEAVASTRFAWIGFSAPAADLEGIPPGTRLRVAPVLADLSSLLNRIDAEDKYRPPFHEERIALLLRDLLLLLRRAARPASRSPAEFRPATAIEASRDYLQRNIREELTIEQVARYHGFSLSHFEVLFSARFGETPKQFQQQCRLRAVEEMMREGIRSPKLLAASLGFNDAAYFCRWLKKWTGLPPSRYFRRLQSSGSTAAP